MMNKKFASLLVAGALMTTLGATPAFAAAGNPVCPINDCTLTGAHQHNGKSYAAHTAGDGHSYHANCGVSGCTQTGSHQHSGGHNGGYHNGGSHRSGGRHC